MAPKKEFFKYSQENLLQALEEINNGAKIRETSRKYGIPHSTIINKIKMRHPVVRKMGPATVLTPQEEDLLCKWIISMAKKGFPVNKENLAQTVQDIIKTDNRHTVFKDNLLGRKWFESFLKRHPTVSQRHAESIDLSRRRVTETAIRKWHSHLHDYLVNENAVDILQDPDRILNSDESGFQTNPASGIVLGPKGNKNFYGVVEKSKENITVLGTFTASGKTMPPLIIYPYERIPSEIVRHVNINWAVGKSPNGWMTCRVFYCYIANSLIPTLKESGVKFPVLLLLDGHRSQISQEVSELCITNQIIFYSLYPNATHILQPADVSVFRSLKHSWKSTVQSWKLKTSHRVLTKALFAPLLENAFKAATPSVVSNGFKKCGLYPFDANAIDYTRCINNDTRHEMAEKPAEIGPEHLLYVESLMRHGRSKEFRQVKDEEEWQGDESAKELFYLWRKMKNRVLSEKTPDVSDLPSDEHTIPASPTAQECPGNTETSTSVEMDLPKNIHLSLTEEQLVLKCNKDTENQENNSPNWKTPTKSTQVAYLVPPRKAQKHPISPAFAEAIFWPTESPIKHAKKTNKVRLPDAISSPAWVKYWDEKNKEKSEKEEKKLARTEKRKAKQEQINKSKKLKPKVMAKKRRIIYSDSSDSEDNTALLTFTNNTVEKPDDFQIGMYVIVQYEGEYFPGVIEKAEQSQKEVSVMVLSTPKTFKWPEKRDTM